MPIFTGYNKKVTKVSDIAEQKGLSGRNGENKSRVGTDDAFNLPSSIYTLPMSDRYDSNGLNSSLRFFPPLNRQIVVRSPFPLIARMLIYPSIQNGFRILSNWSYPYSTGTTILLSCFTTYCRLRIYPHASYISAPFLTRLSMMPEVLAVCRSFATCCQFGQSGKVGPCVSSK